MAIDPERWARIQEVFHAALERPASEREAFLEAECAGDAGLLAEVRSLVEEDARRTSLLERDLAEVADEVLDGSVPHLERVGPYRIRGVLGHGGMGVVYLAEREDLGSRAAIKVLRDAWLSPARRDRFASEQRTLAHLTHPSIARLYDADTLPDGTPYFVMEHVRGVALTEYCETHRCSVADRLRLFRAVCEAVQAAHRQAVIHRDLKPSNILVTEDGSPKLLDFGIAKQLENIDSPATQTQTGLLMTPAYAAPEQVRGEPVGTYTDIYALGVILYELLAGRLPFDLSNRTPGQVEAVIAEQEPERPSAVARRAIAESAGSSPLAPLGRTAWADLDVLCLTAMHKDAQRRYPTVDALMQDLDRYLAGQPLAARPDTARYRLGKFVRRNRRAVAAAAAVIVTVNALVAFYTIRLAAARDAALAEAARTQRIQHFMLSLFTGGDEEAGPADSLRVVTLVDRGVTEAGMLESEPAIQSELYQTLGAIYHQLGFFDRADSLLGSALALRRSLPGAEPAGVAANMVAIGLLRVDQARLEEGERLIRDGLEASRRRFPAGHPSVLEASTALAKALQQRGEYDESIALYEEAARVQTARAPGTAELSATLAELANTHFYAGNLDASDSLNRRVLELDRQLYGERHPHIADALINLGAGQFQRGEYAKSEPFYREALAIFEGYYGPDHPQTASAATMLGQSLLYQDRLDEALMPLRRALDIRERVYGPDHPKVAITLGDLAYIAYQKHDTAGAEAEYRRIVDIYRKAHGDRHYFTAIALANLASLYMNTGQYGRAEPIFRDVVGRFTEARSARDVNTGIARIKLGRTLLRQNRFAEAEKETLLGYEIVGEQSSPSVSWLRSARMDLVAAYEALGQPDKAARFRAEMDAASAPAPK